MSEVSPSVESTATPTPPPSQVQPEGQAPAEPKVEAPKEEVKAEPQDRFATKFAQLAKKERMLQERESRLKQLEASAKEEVGKYREKAERYDKFNEYKTSGRHLDALRELDISYEQLTDDILSGKYDGNTDHMMKHMERVIAPLKDKIKEFEERDAKAKEEAEKASQNQKAHYEKEVANYKKKLADHIETNKETYELIEANKNQGSYGLVWDVIYTAWEDAADKSKVMSIDEACQKVESFLEEEAKKLLNLKKLKAPESDPVKTPKTSEPRATATLTNNLEKPAGQILTPKKYMSRDESIQAALELYHKGQLK